MSLSDLIAEFGPLATALFAAIAALTAWRTTRASSKLQQPYLPHLAIEGTFYEAMVSVEENKIDKNLLIIDINNTSFHSNQIKEVLLGKRKLKFYQTPEDLRGGGGRLRLEFSGVDAEDIVKKWQDLTIVDCANRPWHPEQACTKQNLELA